MRVILFREFIYSYSKIRDDPCFWQFLLVLNVGLMYNIDITSRKCTLGMFQMSWKIMLHFTTSVKRFLKHAPHTYISYKLKEAEGL